MSTEFAKPAAYKNINASQCLNEPQYITVELYDARGISLEEEKNNTLRRFAILRPSPTSTFSDIYNWFVSILEKQEPDYEHNYDLLFGKTRQIISNLDLTLAEVTENNLLSLWFS